MGKRAFVLIPLLEIDPDLSDPKTSVRFADMLKSVGDQGVTAFGEKAGA